MNATMRAVMLNAPGDIELVETAVPVPGNGEVLLKVAACGVCGSDLARMLKKGAWKLPLVCGHEVLGLGE